MEDGKRGKEGEGGHLHYIPGDMQGVSGKSRNKEEGKTEG